MISFPCWKYLLSWLMALKLKKFIYLINVVKPEFDEG
jgi:hypothetical protein